MRRPKRVVEETTVEPRRRPELTRSRPRLEPPKHRVEALKARLSLSMSTLSPGMGDISLDFGVDSGAAGRPVDARELFELAELDEPPRPIMRMNPIYPRGARQRGIEGFVEVLFTITAEGRVTDLRVLRSDPGDVFVEATLEAVRRWRFTSPRKDGRPVNMRARQIVRFELRE